MLVSYCLFWKCHSYYLFWQIKHVISKIRFKIKRFCFQRIEKFRNIKVDSVNFFLNILIYCVFKPLLISLIIFVLLEFIEYRINSKTVFISEIFKRCSINQDRMFDLYLGIAAIIGTFLGLYFTATTIISQTVYSKIKGEIRSLLNADKIANLYIKILIFLLSFVLISIFLMMLKYEIGCFNFILTAFLAFIALISFWKLAIRVFNFFNPVYLIYIYLLPEINQ